MKKIILLSIVFFCAYLSAYTQPVLTAKDINPAAGDVIIQQTAKVKGVKTGKTGANIVWDYSKLKDSSKADTSFFVKPSATPYASAFSSSNLAGYSSSAKGIYVYYITSKNSLLVLGDAVKKTKTKWTPGYRPIAYPFTYGTTFFDASTVTSSTSTFTYNYIDTVKATGYGTLKLPGGRTFGNVLQSKTTTVITYVVSGQTITSTTYSVNYYAKGYHYPLLTISLDATNQVEDISYTDNAVPVANEIPYEAENDIAVNNKQVFTIYPNPAASAFTISGKALNGKSIVQIEINDMSGKNVFIKKTNIIASRAIDCSLLKAGVYMVRIQMNDGSEMLQKLVIAR